MKRVLSFAIGLMVVAMMVGCGGSEQPAKTEKPAEPAFVAQTMNLPAMKVASIAKTGPYAEIGKDLSVLMAAVQEQKLTVRGTPFAVFHDNPAAVKPESTRYEVSVPLDTATKNMTDKKTGMVVKDAEPMMIAVTDYMGPYDQVGPVYEKLYKWIAENKYEAAGPMLEYYLNDPAKVKPESLQTKVGAVIKPVAPPVDTTKKAEEPKKEGPKPPTKK
ncbi:GyrI-like domain-containing protein [candidate division WOR-3 bacterium]|uniref:GyrI-like domain-containing protein n=1 Tax=candidate division WOR-3 bacterium TaxID=2052148 RepID=A0A937XEK0_UNCW3|nr:GyrI-like domain-containing protein [candidate division WOR-3 bacterium]